MPDDRFLHRRAGHSDKVNSLSDLEFRVWTQYLLSADDFGVMRAEVVRLQADNDYLATRPTKALQRCLERLITVTLVSVFSHQKHRYIYQADWQQWQKISYPRTTTQPKPTDLSCCCPATQELFRMHPGGAKKSRREVSETLREDSGNIPRMVPEDSPLTRADAPAKRLTANGERLMANGSEEETAARFKVAESAVEVLDELQRLAPRMDVWARELVNLYPAQGRCKWNLVERPLFSALGDGDPFDGWASIKAALEQHKRSHQWRVKGMIPGLKRWLEEGMYLQELPEGPPAADQMSTRTSRTLHAAAEILKGGDA